jgi:hypothetical protein
LQRNLSLQLGFAGFVGVLGIGAIGAAGQRDNVRVWTVVSVPLAGAGSFVIAHAAFLARSESVIFAGAC